jgi:hypothetical protein
LLLAWKQTYRPTIQNGQPRNNQERERGISRPVIHGQIIGEYPSQQTHHK